MPVKHGVSNRALWLPDGKRLLFLGGRLRSPPVRADWYTVPVEGGKKHLPAPHNGAGPFHRASPQSGSLRRSPDLYRASRQRQRISRPFRFGAGPGDRHFCPCDYGPGVNFWPSASSDGAKIVFGNAPSFNTNLWAMNVDPANGAVAGEHRRVTDGLVDRTAPSPSADGKRIAYKANSGMTARTPSP